MNEEFKKKAAYDLALEYMRQNGKFVAKSDTGLKIEVKEFWDKYNKIYQWLNELL